VLGATIAKSNGVLPGQVEFVIDRVADQKWSLRCAISVARNFPKWDSGRDDLIFLDLDILESWVYSGSPCKILMSKNLNTKFLIANR